MKPVDLYVLLGTNLGDRAMNLAQARLLLQKKIGEIVSESSIYETAPWGKTDQANFLNQVICFSTSLLPQEILDITQGVEKELGRIKKEHWGERIIDIDILYYADILLQENKLKIPHPFIQERRFTLIPLVEIAPHFQHPILKKTNTELLEICSDKLPVHQWNSSLN